MKHLGAVEQQVSVIKFSLNSNPSSYLKQNRKLNKIIFASAVISILAFILLQVVSPNKAKNRSPAELSAALLMEKAMTAIVSFREQTVSQIDEIADPNRTGLIGTELSPLTTTLGQLEAKRTTTNPNFAGLIVHLLDQAGVSSGDTIAIGASASFPALVIAALAAAQAKQVIPLTILSLGASSFGANVLEFNLLDIYQLLIKEKILATFPLMISLGGEKDIGEDFPPEIRSYLLKQINASGVDYFYEPDLPENVALRMNFYQPDSLSRQIAAFINIGGSLANLGTSEKALKVKPGLNTQITDLPPPKERGVLFQMAAHHIPVIHLLNIRDLCWQYRLPWDPLPLPKAGEFVIKSPDVNDDLALWSIAVIYFLILVSLILLGRR